MQKRTGLYEVGSSCTGAPGRRALRSGCDRQIVGHADLGVPTAKRRTVQTNKFVQIRWLEIATASVRTGFAMTNGVACCVIARLAEQAVAAQPLAALPPYGCGVPLAGAIQIQNLCEAHINYSLFTIHYSLFTFHYSLFIISNSAVPARGTPRTAWRRTSPCRTAISSAT